MSTTPFKVLVRDLPAHRRVEVGPDYVSTVLAGLPMRDVVSDAPAGTGVLEVDVYAEGAHVHASGHMKGHVTVACSRCVSPAAVPIDEEIHASWLPEAELAQAEAEKEGKAPDAEEEGVELAAADLDVYPFDGESVDLEPLIREQLVLAVPYAPLCRDECKGLCPQCGVDKNVETCACEKPLDPRFAALKGLKLPS